MGERERERGSRDEIERKKKGRGRNEGRKTVAVGIFPQEESILYTLQYLY